MNRVARSSVGAIIAVAMLLVAKPAEAQPMCNDATMLPDPIIVTGSLGFEPILRQVALKLSVQTSPRTIIFATNTASSCPGIASVAGRVDLGGTAGFHYVVSGTTYVRDSCTFAPGQKAHVAISDVFYESCSSLPQPKPANLMDALGPVQATAFFVPISDTTTQVLTYPEVRAIYGCGVSSTRPIAGFKDPMATLCGGADAGPAAILAANLGLPLSAVTPPQCPYGGGTGIAMAQNLAAVAGSGVRVFGFLPADGVTADVRALASPIAFQSLGQTQAYYPDSVPGMSDRQNVRNGHYTLWGYEHLFAASNDGALGREASDFIGWLTGTKINTSFDYVGIEGGAGMVPLCAMRVKRASDGGLLSPYAHPEPCDCAGEAALARTIPATCVVCTSDTMCGGGKTCRRGFCE